MRSTRTITWRSAPPTDSSMRASAAATSGSPPTARSRSASLDSGDDEGGRPRRSPRAGRGQPGPEGGRPALRVEPARRRSGPWRQQLVAHGGGEHPQDGRVGERGVGEVGGAQVGPQLGQERGRHQGQVVVLDEDPAPLGCHLGHPLGHQPVEGAVGVPGLHPPPVGPGPAGRVEQVVVAEPQGGVGDHVVGEVVDVGRRARPSSIRSPSAAIRPWAAATRSASLSVDGHPGGAGALDQGVERPARPPPRCGGDGPAVLHAEGQRAPVGDQDGVGQRPVRRGRRRPAGTGRRRGHAGTLPRRRPTGHSHPAVGRPARSGRRRRGLTR